jgi:hypothetical protein
VGVEGAARDDRCAQDLTSGRRGRGSGQGTGGRPRTGLSTPRGGFTRAECGHDDGASGALPTGRGTRTPRGGWKYAGCRVARRASARASQSACCPLSNSNSLCSNPNFPKILIETLKSVHTEVVDGLTTYNSCKGW